MRTMKESRSSYSDLLDAIYTLSVLSAEIPPAAQERLIGMAEMLEMMNRETKEKGGETLGENHGE